MAKSLRENILATKNARYEILTSKHWTDEEGNPLKIKVRGMSYAARTSLLKDCAIGEDRVDMVKMVPRAIIETFTDPLNDQPIFQEADADVIASQSPEAIEEARQVVWRVIGLSAEQLEKNSEQTAVSGASSV